MSTSGPVIVCPVSRSHQPGNVYQRAVIVCPVSHTHQSGNISQWASDSVSSEYLAGESPAPGDYSGHTITGPLVDITWQW